MKILSSLEDIKVGDILIPTEYFYRISKGFRNCNDLLQCEKNTNLEPEIVLKRKINNRFWGSPTNPKYYYKIEYPNILNYLYS